MGIKFHIYIIFIFSCCLFLESSSQSNNRIFFDFQKKTSSIIQKDNDLLEDYHISFLLPFCVQNNEFIFSENIDSILLINNDLVDFDFYKKTKISIDFFLGFLLSINHFSELNIAISVFDIQEGETSKEILSNILHEEDLRKSDIIIGPLFTDNFVFFSERFRKSIPLVSPFSKKPEIIQNNEHVFQATPDLLNQLSFFSDYIFNKHIYDNILIIRRDTILKTNMQRFLDSDQYMYETDTIVPDDITYGKFFLEDIDTAFFHVEEILVNTHVIDSIHHKLDTLGMKNIIIIPSEDNVFVTDLLSKLHACRDTTMVVYGLPLLADFNHLSIYDLMDMKVTFPHNSIFKSTEIQHFLIDFYDNYNYVPNLKYSSVGYELGFYFLELLSKYGSVLDYIDDYESQTILGTTYDFKKEEGLGYRNIAALIFRYHDFEYFQIH